MWFGVLSVVEPEVKRPAKDGHWHSHSNGNAKLCRFHLKCDIFWISVTIIEISRYVSASVAGCWGSVSGPKWRIAILIHWGPMTHICVFFALSVPNHYLNQCWNIVIWTLGKFQSNWNIFIQENSFEYVVWKMAVILSRPQCVNTLQPGQNGWYFAKTFSNTIPWKKILVLWCKFRWSIFLRSQFTNDHHRLLIKIQCYISVIQLVMKWISLWYLLFISHKNAGGKTTQRKFISYLHFYLFPTWS